MNDLRFPTAVQMMLSLALTEREGRGLLTSSQIAEGLGANPSLVRKLLVPLVRDGLVRSFLGKNGGVSLGRPPEAITLRDVYVSVTEGKKLWSARVLEIHGCVVSSNVEEFVESLADEAEQAMLASLGRHTLAQGLAEMGARDKARRAKRSPAS